MARLGRTERPADSPVLAGMDRSMSPSRSRMLSCFCLEGATGWLTGTLLVSLSNKSRIFWLWKNNSAMAFRQDLYARRTLTDLTLFRRNGSAIFPATTNF